MNAIKSNLPKKDLKFFGHSITDALGDGNQAFAFFLGAGCSVGSGILPASTLCLKWIRELKRQATGTSLDADTWYSLRHPEFTKSAAGAFYAQVIQERFPNMAMRRMEVQRFVSNKDPGFGYVALAGLMSDLEYGPRCNVALTTNFDDLLHDALNIFFNAKPMLIMHDEMAKFALPEIKRPLILKLHGDALIEPKNTAAETSSLSDAATNMLLGVLKTRGLIFMGYSGGDESIASTLAMLPDQSLPYGIYWINKSLPANPKLVRWLEKRGAVWIAHTDFDEVMMTLSVALKLRRPNDRRFRELLANYEAGRTFVERKLLIKEKSDNSNIDVFIKLVRKTTTDDPKAIPALLDAEVLKNPKDAALLGFCAQQKRRLKDYDGARSLYNAAIEVDPDHASNLCHFASFIMDIDCDLLKQEHKLETARTLLRQACASAPYNPLALGAYGSFLWTRDKNTELAEDFFQRALQADHGNSETLASYANFLWRARDRFEEALEYYEQSYSINPSSFRMLANFSQLLFLSSQKGRARDYALTALRRAPSETVQLEAAFYLLCNDKKERRNDYLHQIHGLIYKGARSPGWDLNPTVDEAARNNHEWKNLLRALADVISKGTLADGLKEFAAWEAVTRA